MNEQIFISIVVTDMIGKGREEKREKKTRKRCPVVNVKALDLLHWIKFVIKSFLGSEIKWYMSKIVAETHYASHTNIIHTRNDEEEGTIKKVNWNAFIISCCYFLFVMLWFGGEMDITD